MEQDAFKIELSELIKKSGLSKRQFSMVLGMSFVSIHKMLAGRTRIRKTIILASRQVLRSINNAEV